MPQRKKLSNSRRTCSGHGAAAGGVVGDKAIEVLRHQPVQQRLLRGGGYRRWRQRSMSSRLVAVVQSACRRGVARRRPCSPVQAGRYQPSPGTVRQQCNRLGRGHRPPGALCPPCMVAAAKQRPSSAMGKVRHLAGAASVGACATAVLSGGGSPRGVYSLAGGARILALRRVAVGRTSFDASCINFAAMALKSRGSRAVR